MARNLGREQVTYYTKEKSKVFDSPDVITEIRAYRGCWVEFRSSTEGVGASSAVDRTLAGIWIPTRINTTLGSSDYFVWERSPQDWYAVDGQTGAYFDRQGRFRASFIPVRRVGATPKLPAGGAK